jgi:ADP-heptose:LPS heptosyltransferase
MLPSGHYQAVITLHDTWAYGKGAADRFLKHYITSHRYIGSKDRQQIATLFFGLFRHRRLLDEALGEPAPKSYKRLLAYLLLKETLSPEMVMETWHQGKVCASSPR